MELKNEHRLFRSVFGDFKSFTYCKQSSINNVDGQDEDGWSDGRPVSKVRAGDGEAPDQTDGPVYDHAQAPEEHRSEPVPVAASYIKLSINKKSPSPKF